MTTPQMAHKVHVTSRLDRIFAIAVAGGLLYVGLHCAAAAIRESDYLWTLGAGAFFALAGIAFHMSVRDVE